MIDLFRDMAQPLIFEAVLSVLTIIAGWATWLKQKATRTEKEAFAQSTIHSAAETFTDLMLDVLEQAVRNGTPVGRIDGYLGAGMDWIKSRSAPGSVKVLDATSDALRTILEAKANAKMLEIKAKLGLDPLTGALRDAGAPVR